MLFLKNSHPDYYSYIRDQNIIKADFHCKPPIFFYFVTWISFIFWWFQLYSWTFWQDKIEKLGWYSWNPKQKSSNSGTPLGPRASSPPLIRRFALLCSLRSALGTSGVPEKFQFIFLVGFHGTTQALKFCCQKYPWNAWNNPKNQWNQVTKKMRGFHLEENLWAQFYMRISAWCKWRFSPDQV